MESHPFKIGQQRVVATLYRLSQESRLCYYFRPIQILSDFPQEWNGIYDEIGIIIHGGKARQTKTINRILEPITSIDNQANSLILLAMNYGSKFYRTNPNGVEEIERFLGEIRCPQRKRPRYQIPQSNTIH